MQIWKYTAETRARLPLLVHSYEEGESESEPKGVLSADLLPSFHSAHLSLREEALGPALARGMGGTALSPEPKTWFMVIQGTEILRGVFMHV